MVDETNTSVPDPDDTEQRDPTDRIAAADATPERPPRDAAGRLDTDDDRDFGDEPA